MLKKSDGAAIVELAIILPLLLLLAFGVFELGRALQAKNIITNMSREGANLAARNHNDYSNQEIMNSIATTSAPLDMSANGMIFITEVMGVDDAGTVNPIVQGQYRYVGGGYAANSVVWDDCGEWTAGECTTFNEDLIADLEGDGNPSDGHPYSGMETVEDGGIKNGETVYAVEVFYDYAPIISYVIDHNLKIYSRNVF